MALRAAFSGALRKLFAVVCGWSVVACGGERAPGSSPAVPESAILVPSSITRLVEPDTAFIGLPIYLAVSSRNEYLVVDRYSLRVSRFDSVGQFKGTFGREGYGPNEFKQPAFLQLVDDTTALVVDRLRRDFTLWNVNSSSVVARVPIEGEPGPFIAVGGSITGAVFDRFRGTIAARWRRLDSAPEHLGTLPAAFAPTNRFATIYGHIPFTIFQDSIAYLTGESNYMRIADSLWIVVDSTAIPRRIRRGAPETIDTALTAKTNIYDISRQLSTPFAVHRLSNGRFAVLHLDYAVRNNLALGSMFLTILSKQNSSRCTDILLPVHDSTAIPEVSFRGDTLFVLDQYILGERAVTDVLRFTLDLGVC